MWYVGTALMILFLTLVFHRAILTVVYWCALILCGVVALRVVMILLPELDRNSFWASSALGVLSGFIVVGILCASWIRQAVIWFYLQDTIERSKAAASKGKMW